MFKLYELVNNKENPISFSAYVIAVKLFLMHKGLEFETVSLNYPEVKPTISKLTDGKWNQVPLLIAPNGDQIYDSLEIGKYLEKNYPNPAMNANNPELEKLILDFVAISGISYSLCIMKHFTIIDESDKAYFLESRPKLLGMSIEEFTKDLDGNLKLYYEKTINIGEILDNSPYLNGNEPGIYDYLLAGQLQCNRLINPEAHAKLTDSHPKKSIAIWFEKMLDMYDGWMRNANSVKNIKKQ